MKILNKPSATIEQCQEWINGVKTAHPIAKAMVPLLWDAAIANGIDPCVLIAQAMKETGYFNFKGVIRPNFCNTCGLKITKGGGDLEPGAHMRFDYWEDGIMAHSDHLALYAGSSNTPKYSPECASHQNEQYKKNGTTKDPRHFTYLHGKCKSVEDLSGNWAPGKDYGQEIVRIANQMINTKVNKHECSGVDSNKVVELEQQLMDMKDNLVTVLNEKANVERELNQLREEFEREMQLKEEIQSNLNEEKEKNLEYIDKVEATDNFIEAMNDLKAVYDK